jgi:endoplasmic reticulum-Golgi intermediate compartment protein 3
VRAYQERDWNVAGIMRNSTQCIHDRVKHFEAASAGEGCTVSGVMKVNKVAGNFHIAHGESLVRDGRHIHHFNPTLAPSFNVSHTINSLTFGAQYPNMPSNPLDGGMFVQSFGDFHKYAVPHCDVSLCLSLCLSVSLTLSLQ